MARVSDGERPRQPVGAMRRRLHPICEEWAAVSELPQEVGTAKGKARRRDEWGAYCYGRGLRPAAQSDASALAASSVGHRRGEKELPGTRRRPG